MDLVGNTVMVEEDMEEEGKLRMAEEEGKRKDREGKLKDLEDKQLREEEDKLKLVGMPIAAESIVLVGTEMVQSRVVMNMEMEQAVLSTEVLEGHMVVLMAQTRNFVSLRLHNAVLVLLLPQICQFWSEESRYSRRIPEKEPSATES